MTAPHVQVIHHALALCVAVQLAASLVFTVEGVQGCERGVGRELEEHGDNVCGLGA